MADENIQQLQEALTLCGHNPGSVDGKMGPNTKGAIKAFQEARGLDADGIAGPNTKQALVGALGEASARATALITAFA